MTAWVECYARLLNVKFEWPSNELPEVHPTANPFPVCLWLWSEKHLAGWNATRLLAPHSCPDWYNKDFEFEFEMLKAAEEGVELARQVVEAGWFQQGWDPEESFVLNLFKARVKPLTMATACGSGVAVRCGCLVTWFCYQMIAKPGNKTAAPSWPDPCIIVLSSQIMSWSCWNGC